MSIKKETDYQSNRRLSEEMRRIVAQYVEKNYIPGEDLESPMPFTYGTPIAATLGTSKPIKPFLGLKKQEFYTEESFADTLLKLIDERGLKPSEVYKKARVSRQTFSKINSDPDYRPTKVTAISFAIALELDVEQTQDLIARAGYALSKSILFDVIVKCFIENGHYDFDEINEALYEYDQGLLGAL